VGGATFNPSSLRADLVFLHTAIGNTAARRLYLSQGFKVAAHVPFFYASQSDPKASGRRPSDLDEETASPPVILGSSTSHLTLTPKEGYTDDACESSAAIEGTSKAGAEPLPSSRVATMDDAFLMYLPIRGPLEGERAAAAAEAMSR